MHALEPAENPRIRTIEQRGIVVHVGQHSLQRRTRFPIHRVLRLSQGHEVESGDVQVEFQDRLGVPGETFDVDGHSTASDVTNDHFGRGGAQGNPQSEEEGDE